MNNVNRQNKTIKKKSSMTSSAVSVSPVVPIDLISVKSYAMVDLVLVL